jgi:hypothetical protein
MIDAGRVATGMQGRGRPRVPGRSRLPPVRHSVADWLRYMHLVPAGRLADLDRYIGYWQPYATSHDELDRDQAVQQEVRNAARTLLEAIQATRSGRQVSAGGALAEPRQK